MTIQSVYSTDSLHLAKLMELDADNRGLWRPEELGAILRHQLDSPLVADLRLDEVVETEVGGKPPERASLQTFSELFHNPQPPIHLLRLTKEFGKKNRSNPNSALPHEIATVLYFVSIFIALLRCGERITSLDNASLRRGAEWIIAQNWVDEATRSIVRESLHRIPGAENRTV